MVGSLWGLLRLFFFIYSYGWWSRKDIWIFYHFFLSLLILPYLSRLIFEEKRCQGILCSLLSISPSKQKGVSHPSPRPSPSFWLSSFQLDILILSTNSIIIMLLLGLQVIGGTGGAICKRWIKSNFIVHKFVQSM